MLEIDDPSKLNRNNSARSFQSPRSRPKEKAPPPPIMNSTRTSGTPTFVFVLLLFEDPPLIDLADDWTTVNRAEAAKLYAHHANNHQPFHGGEDLSTSIDRGHSGMGNSESFDSLDSFDDYTEESLSCNNTERRPSRPPPPVSELIGQSKLHFQAMRQLSEMANPRPVSYNMAIHHDSPHPMPRTQPLVIENPLAKAPSIRKPTVLPDTNVGITDDNNR